MSEKNALNKLKHGISFEEAQTVFYDYNAILFDKPAGRTIMRDEYDIKNLNPRKNPYAKHLKKQITINIDVDTISYFKDQAQDTGIPYQTLMNLYLSDCASQKKTLKLNWE